MITASVVSTQFDDALFAHQSGEKAGRENPVFHGRWNWGAFLWNWLWLANMRRGWLAFGIFVLTCIPIVGLVAVIYLGIKGNDIAYDGRRFISIEQYVKVQNAWRNWGFWLSGIALGLAVIGGIISRK